MPKINTVDKVDGRLPDLGEVLALSRLNAMCEDIRMIYPKGAELTVATDGLVFDGELVSLVKITMTSAEFQHRYCWYHR
jgi:pyoverdine/dityrosine biosynthesis protein Dit1